MTAEQALWLPSQAEPDRGELSRAKLTSGLFSPSASRRSRMIPNASIWRACLATSLTFAAALAGCSPLISVEEGESMSSADMPQPTSSGAGSAGPECTPNVEQECWCPAMARGTKFCEPGGEFGPCICEPVGTTGEVADTSSDGSTSTGGTTSDSSTGSEPPFEPVPCLPLREPCNGPIRLETNADVVEVAACSRIAGSLRIEPGVTDLTPLACLRELSNSLFVSGVDMPSLAGLSQLERIEGELSVGWTGLAALDLGSLDYINHLSLDANDSLVTLGLPSLQLIEGGMAAFHNPLLPTCELESLAEDVLGPTGSVQYFDNGEDGCASIPDPR